MLYNMNACLMRHVCSESRWRWFIGGLTWPSLRLSEKLNIALLLLYSVDFCYCVRVQVFTFYLYKCGRTRARHAFSLIL